MNPPEEPGRMRREDQSGKSRGKFGQKSHPGGEGGYAHRRLTRQTGQNRGGVAGEQETSGRYNVRLVGNSLPDLIRASKSPARGKTSRRHANRQIGQDGGLTPLVHMRKAWLSRSAGFFADAASAGAAWALQADLRLDGRQLSLDPNRILHSIFEPPVMP